MLRYTTHSEYVKIYKMAQKDIGNKTPLHELKTTKDVMHYYDEWSKNNKYNKDMNDWDYCFEVNVNQSIDRTDADADSKAFNYL